jgi:hypothetical protein
MQDMFDWMKQYEGQMVSADQVVLKAHSLFSKEKDIIIQSWKEGWKQGANFSADPELYFTSNFLSNEEKS